MTTKKAAPKKAQPQKAKGAVGRPSSFKPEYCEQARKLCLFGISDTGIAFFFDVDVETLAAWANQHPAFLVALCPTQEEIDAYAYAVDSKRKLRSARRKASTSPSQRIRAAVSGRMWSALKAQGIKKDRKLFDALGYSMDDLVRHLEGKFSAGMTWENYGRWHVDHIKPCALFDLTDSNQFDQCWALSNLQPLWASENVRKGARYACA